MLTAKRRKKAQQAAEAIVDNILKENYLKRDSLIPMVKTLLLNFIRITNVSEELDVAAFIDSEAERLKESRRDREELEYWKNLVRDRLDPLNIEKYYNELKELGLRKS